MFKDKSKVCMCLAFLYSIVLQSWFTGRCFPRVLGALPGRGVGAVGLTALSGLFGIGKSEGQAGDFLFHRVDTLGLL